MGWQLYALLGAIFAALLLALVWALRREGRKSAEAARHMQTVDQAREAHAIDDDVARLDGDALDDSLRGD